MAYIRRLSSLCFGRQSILVFICALLTFSNSVKKFKIDRNMSELRQIVCQCIILT